MKIKLKILIGKITTLLTSICRKFALGRFILESLINELIGHVITINYEGKEFIFSVPNELNRIRVKTFSTKEPETLSWIDEFNKNGVFWDIGANVGLYSIYAGKTKDMKVFSFEPSVFNLELLARNIQFNRLVNCITIIPIPLTDSLSINTLRMSSMVWGGALSSFGQEFGHDGKTLNKVFEFSVPGITMDDAVERLNIPWPDYIKIDVDGIEHLILSGGKKVLQNTKEILIELNEDFPEQFDKSCEILKKSGFQFKEKRKSEMTNLGVFKNTFNQIWIKQKSNKH
jgi:FkbM family methyltransferase